VFSSSKGFSDKIRKNYDFHIDNSFSYSYEECLAYIMRAITFPSRTMFYGIYKLSCLKNIRKHRIYSKFNPFPDEHLLLFSLIFRYKTFRYTPDTYFLKRSSGYYLDRYTSYQNRRIDLYFLKRCLVFLQSFFVGIKYYFIVIYWISLLKLNNSSKIYFSCYYTKMVIICYGQMLREIWKVFRVIWNRSF
jgi:hypothetical protein